MTYRKRFRKVFRICRECRQLDYCCIVKCSHCMEQGRCLIFRENLTLCLCGRPVARWMCSYAAVMCCCDVWIELPGKIGKRIERGTDQLFEPELYLLSAVKEQA